MYRCSDSAAPAAWFRKLAHSSSSPSAKVLKRLHVIQPSRYCIERAMEALGWHNDKARSIAEDIFYPRKYGSTKLDLRTNTACSPPVQSTLRIYPHITHNMCNGESGRASQGGTIAFLRPTASTQRPSPRRELSLRLASDNGDGRTTATFQGLDPSTSHASHVIIQYACSTECIACLCNC